MLREIGILLMVLDVVYLMVEMMKRKTFMLPFEVGFVPGCILLLLFVFVFVVGDSEDNETKNNGGDKNGGENKSL
ncbi:MAG: hypothetical protein PHH12_01810 [Candidatus Shapirobacteria bacterium]|nr:hypothetical protein [Candidatus Shapirobacteria bacterium]